MIQKTQRGNLDILPGKGIYESFEATVNGIMRAALEESGSIALKNLDSCNRLKEMVTCGSKGSNLNISQIMACVGQ